MVSPNQLLGSGIPIEPVTEEDTPIVNLRTPAWRFHKDFPNRLCKTDVELDKLDAEGWVDKPGKARRLPGHEKIYDEYHSMKVSEPVEVVVIQEKTEDQIRADTLKTESDRVEENRLEAIRKVEEKRSQDERKAEEKRLKEERKIEEKRLEDERKATESNPEPEPKSEETILKEYEEAKSPPGPRLCTLCGLTFPTLLGLNRHGARVHRGKKRNNL